MRRERRNRAEDGSEVFAGRTWNDVRAVVLHRTAKKFPRAKRDDLEDAVQYAMVHLFDYWLGRDASDDGEANWSIALLLGTRRAKHFLVQMWVDKKHERCVDPSDLLAGLDQQAGQPPYDDDEFEEAGEDEADTLLRQLAESEPWLRDYLDGKGPSECARERGVSRQAVHNERNRGMRRLEKQFRG